MPVNTNFKETVFEYLKSKDIDRLKLLLNSASEVEVLDAMEDLSSKEQVIVYRLLSKDRALFVFEQLDTILQERLISAFTEEEAIKAIEELDPDDRVRLLDELPATVAKKMLASISKEEREYTNLLMGYEPETAGRIMTPEYVRLRREMTALEALEKVKALAKSRNEQNIYTLYITDEKRRLEGVLSLRNLLIADPSEKIENIMRTNYTWVSTDTDQEEVAKILQKIDALALPVVDKENLLVGIITVDDTMDILQEESTEDIFNKAGMTDLAKTQNARSEVLVRGSLWKIWKVRMPFLIITLFGGLLAGSVIHNFEDVLGQVFMVAIFIPVIMDMGGNIGVQSSTVFQRGIVLGHIKPETIWKHIRKELSVGLSMGLVVGVATGIVAWVWHGEPMLGVALFLALVITMTFASFLGFIVPFILIKLNIDQAAGTDPIITSIKDITGLFIYFILVSFFLSHLLYPAL
ncbi:MAG: magnesium transporter [Defluviitaleaceae bacterium]|nr:magnesium transporter [Defluviitaleaceae bacterium]